MINSELSELQIEVNELTRILGFAKRESVKKVLQDEISKTNEEITVL